MFLQPDSEWPPRPWWTLPDWADWQWTKPEPDAAAALPRPPVATCALQVTGPAVSSDWLHWPGTGRAPHWHWQRRGSTLRNFKFNEATA
jgi:hypothetical protein